MQQKLTIGRQPKKGVYKAKLESSLTSEKLVKTHKQIGKNLLEFSQFSSLFTKESIIMNDKKTAKTASTTPQMLYEIEQNKKARKAYNRQIGKNR